MTHAGALAISLTAGLLLPAASPPSDDALPPPPAAFPEQPGKWEIDPPRLVAGQEADIELRYTHGTRPLPAGSTHIVWFEPLSVEDLLHARPSNAIELVDHGEAALPRIVVGPMEVHGLGYGAVELHFPDGLEPGDRFALRYGNRLADGMVKGMVAPIPAQDLTFQIYTRLGSHRRRHAWLNSGWVGGLPTVSIQADVPDRIRLFAPSIVARGARFRLRIAVVDAYDSRPDPGYAGEVGLDAPASLGGLPPQLVLSAGDDSHGVIDGLAFDTTGVFRIRARLAEDGPWFESNPIVVKEHVERAISWGSLHHHTLYSEGWGGTLTETFEQARDMAGFDFFAVSDHWQSVPRDDSMSRLTKWRERRQIAARDAWRDTVETTQAFHDPGRFVTLAGYELSMHDSGHYNVYWGNFDELSLDADAERHFPPRYTDYVHDLKQHVKGTRALLIPHKHAARFPYLSLAPMDNDRGEPMVPVMEVYSDWGEAVHPRGERDTEGRFGALRAGQSFLWALDQGHELGLISDADHHAGLPGRRQPFGVSPTHDHPQGLTAARSIRLDREGLLDAYRQRRTYGTTGERVYLDVRVGTASMGGVHRTDEDVEFLVEYAGTAPIAHACLYDGLDRVAEWIPADAKIRDATFRFRCEPWLTEDPVADGPRGTMRPTRTGRRLTLAVGSPEEEHYIVNDLGSRLRNDTRYTDGKSTIVYGFAFPRGEAAFVDVDIDQQFLVSVSTDGVSYEDVLEEPRRLTRAGNRAERRIELTRLLIDHDQVFLKFADRYPDDGWGSRFRSITVESGSVPERAVFSEKDVRFRYKDRAHPYLVEIVQTDGHMAWSSPIWVERKSLPDLKWERSPDGQPRLTNAGNAVARDIEIAHAADEHGFLNASIAGPTIRPDDEKFFLWTDRFDDRRTRVHARWYGSTPLSGRILLEGVRGYVTSPNITYFELRGRHTDDRHGTVEFSFPAADRDGYCRSIGLDFEIENDPAVPNRVMLELDSEVAVEVGGESTTCDAFSLPLNGRKTNRSILRTIVPELGPGESWAPTDASAGYWAADPSDLVAERDEDNNLWNDG